jgi:hypothetical protein
MIVFIFSTSSFWLREAVCRPRRKWQASNARPCECWAYAITNRPKAQFSLLSRLIVSCVVYTAALLDFFRNPEFPTI